LNFLKDDKKWKPKKRKIGVNGGQHESTASSDVSINNLTNEIQINSPAENNNVKSEY
jgi:hypothetical protein